MKVTQLAEEVILQWRWW